MKTWLRYLSQHGVSQTCKIVWRPWNHFPSQEPGARIRAAVSKDRPRRDGNKDIPEMTEHYCRIQPRLAGLW